MISSYGAMLKLILNFAIRNLFRARLRSALTLVMISSVFATLLLAQALMRARNQDIVDTVTNSFIGAYQIQTKDYSEDHRLVGTISDEKFAELAKKSEPAKLTRRAYIPSLISSPTDSFQIILVGIDPDLEKQVTRVTEFVQEGSYLDGKDDCAEPQLIIGMALAKLLKVKLGEKVVLLTQAADQTIGNDLFRISGTYSSKSDTFDRSYAFADIRCARAFAGIAGSHEIVFKSDAAVEKTVGEKIRPTMEAGHVLLSWKDKIPEVFRTVKANDVTTRLMTTILFFIILLSLINTFLLSMIERTREFSMMIAIGIAPLKICLMILAEILVAGLAGIALGTLIGTLAIFYYQKVGFDLALFYGDATEFGGFAFNLIIYPLFSFADYFRLCFVALFFVLLSGLYPAYITLKKRPKEIM